MESVRLDKWLWGTRVYKTRSDAAEACRGSAVRHNGIIAKPSAKIRTGDTIIARTKALTRTLHVVGLTEKRVGAALCLTTSKIKHPNPSLRQPAKNARTPKSSATKAQVALPRKTAATSSAC